MNPLTIFPKHPSAPDTYHIGGAWTPACITAVDKRFSDAELAAEHWCYCTGWFAAVRDDDGYGGGPATRELARRATILERFATLPHYDENPA